MADTDTIKDDLLEQIDEAVEPDAMSAAEAYEVLAELRADIGFRMEALYQENEPESEDW